MTYGGYRRRLEKLERKRGTPDDDWTVCISPWDGTADVPFPVRVRMHARLSRLGARLIACMVEEGATEMLPPGMTLAGLKARIQRDEAEAEKVPAHIEKRDWHVWRMAQYINKYARPGRSEQERKAIMERAEAYASDRWSEVPTTSAARERPAN